MQDANCNDNSVLEHVNSSVRLDDTLPGIGYTLKHRRAVALLTDYHCKKAIGKKDAYGQVFTKDDYVIMHNRALCHDMDKILCGLCYPQLTVDYFHRLFNGHHIENIMNSMSKYDIIEAIMDVDSARYTKPDKGMSPFEVFHPQKGFKGFMWPFVAPYLKLFGMTTADRTVNPTIFEQCKQPVYETELINAIIKFTHATNIHRMPAVARIDDEAALKVGILPPYRHMLHCSTGIPKQLPNQKMIELGGWDLRRNLIKGTLSAQVFDMDAICKIPAGSVDAINRRAKELYTDLIQKKLHR